MTIFGTLLAALALAACGGGDGNKAPTVTLTPGTQTVANGADATFTATASDPDGDTLTYAWYVDDAVQTGETGATFTLSRTPAAETSYTIRVVVSDGNRADEATATLTVQAPGANTAPTVTIAPTAITVNNGASQTFTATAADADGDTLTYAWYVDGTVESGETGTTFTLSRTPTPETDYTIRVVVSDGTDTAEATATLTVRAAGANQAPTVTIAPTAITVDSGANQTFTASASDPDGDTLTYAWYVDGTLESGETGTTFTLNRTPATQTDYLVRVTVSDGTLSADATATLTVRAATTNQAPTVTIAPPTITVSNGADQLFTATASDPDSGPAALTYAWYVDGTLESGETGTTFTLNRTPAAETVYAVRVVVSDSEDTAAATAMATVQKPNVAPTVTLSPPTATVANGQSQLFTASANDPDTYPNASLTYAWYVDGVLQNGETGTTFTLTRSPASETVYTVRVVVDDGGDTAQDESDLTVMAPNVPPTVDIVEGDQSVLGGETATFTADATDTDQSPGALTYQWYVDGVLQNGETNSTFSYSETPTTPTDYVISVVVSDTEDTDEASAILSVWGVNVAPIVTIREGNLIGDNGDTQTFTADATDTDNGPVALTYAWYVDGTLQTDETGPTFTMTRSPTSLSDWDVRVEVFDGSDTGSDEVIYTMLGPKIEACTSPSGLMITGIIDGPLTDGTPKAVELYALTDVDLTDYSLQRQQNANTNWVNSWNGWTGTNITAGTYIYVSHDTANFTAWFGFGPDWEAGTNSVVSNNGDDRVGLFHTTHGLVDIYGALDTDGSGTTWDYQDSWGYRKHASCPSATFEETDWLYGGRNALDGETDNATAAVPMPVGSYAEPTGVPELVFSEILYNSADSEPAYEWAEIFNGSSSAVDLSGWVLDDDDNSALSAANIASGTVGPGETAILYNADSLTTEALFIAAWTASPNAVAVTDWPGFGNGSSGDRIALWSSFTAYGARNFSAATTDLHYGVGSGWPTSSNGRSIYLQAIAADPTVGSNWIKSALGAVTPLGICRAGGEFGNDIASP